MAKRSSAEDPPAPTQSRPAKRRAEANSRFVITLACPTPLAHRELEVVAADAGEAVRLFNRANGIGGSDHRYSIRKVPTLRWRGSSST